MTFLEHGSHETLKQHYHEALGLLAVGAVIYNGSAWLARRQWHLVVNVGLYSLLLAIELKKIKHHRDAALIVLLTLSCGACVHSTNAIKEGVPITTFTVPGWVPSEALFCVEQPPAVDGTPMVWTPVTCPMTIATLRAAFKGLQKADQP